MYRPSLRSYALRTTSIGSLTSLTYGVRILSGPYMIVVGHTAYAALAPSYVGNPIEAHFPEDMSRKKYRRTHPIVQAAMATQGTFGGAACIYLLCDFLRSPLRTRERALRDGNFQW